ncbi:unnamed protein product [Camellia sinensis]
MAYDFYGPTWSSVTNPPTELFDPPSGSVSGSCGIKSWILAGLSPKNMVLGMPFYEYAWKLVNANNHGFKAPSSGPVGSGRSMGYDDIQSITAKVSYAKQHGLLGYFAWHVGVDNNWALSQQEKRRNGLGNQSIQSFIAGIRAPVESQRNCKKTKSENLMVTGLNQNKN